ncbi:MAG: RnfABCDGE type electron transport complex subunit B [Elusimicrobiota bacterium]|nr:RnfABCDGE type electron transport complex subunit B [Endomicrobiia bacterium]MDW8164956.1 RnfABCDGE type electron transport complex subunit B [Elusimicrobiota bacterium]
MSENIVLQSLVVMGSCSVIIAILLGFAAKKFKVEEDPKKEYILSVLPGANCGACGYAGCEQYAEAIVKDNVEINLCRPGGDEVSKKIASILGKEVKDLQRLVAVVLCAGGNRAKNEFVYTGIKKCDISNKFFEGEKACKYGCLGFGDCVEVCPFGAIFINEYNVAEVDVLKCTGCGLCVKVCPKKLIRLVPCNYKVHILCNSRDKGVKVKQICSVGCIGCGICVKACPVSDIYLENNLAIMKYNKCNNCGICKAKCPTKSIDAKIIIKEELKIFN